ncbi:MAG: TIGR03621 family F420-dependent LLM class oxidoreductase [Acidimicrobiia bacterium]|nr:TIGR03621 family F420-dependent LLM class oxidoreductase [Acidimicrobiia bacterium]
MARPCRFGIQLSTLPADGWVERVRSIESLGYSTLFLPDHFGPQLDPTVAMTAVAAVTETLNVGSLVYGIDYRHPVVYAKQAATLHLLSGGRHEFGLGAGWMQSDYDEAGIGFDEPGVRVSRLAEALTLIRSMWTEERTTFEGEHFRVTDIASAARLPAGKRPRIVVGGGGRRLLSVAAAQADIVGINPALPHGRVVAETPSDLTPDRVAEKVGWVRDAARAAGRDPDDIELSSLSFMVSITDQGATVRDGIAQGLGMSGGEVECCPLFIVGTAEEIRDQLVRRRELFGISYVVISTEDPALIEAFAEIAVRPLTGT